MSRRILFVVITTAIASAGCSNESDSEGIGSHSEYAETVAKLGGKVIVRLDFSGSKITDDILADLELADTVHSISLSRTAITDRGVVELNRARNLEYVDLTETQVTDKVVDHLKQLPNVCRVRVTIGSNLSNKSYEELFVFFGNRSRNKPCAPHKPVPRLPVEGTSSK